MTLNKDIKIIDNFFDRDDFKELTSFEFGNVKKKDIRVFHNTISKQKIVKNDFLKKELINRIHQKYHKKVFKILEELSPEKSKLYDYTDLVLIETGSEYKYPIHDDTPNKLLSGVIYINPKKNAGTSFYDSRFGKNKKTIEWKKNRAVFFSRKEFETWHSYEGNGIDNRVALVYNLNTYKIKEVYRIENKNYILGKLRHKLNPYLYEFFRTVI